MGIGFAVGMWIKDTGYVSDDKGKPRIIWSADAQAICQQLGIDPNNGHLTLSDEEGLIIGMAVLMKA